MKNYFAKIAALSVALVSTTSLAFAFDRETTEALKACHDYLWDVPEYANLPNAAISVWLASVDDGLLKAYWVVDWTDPEIREAGQCEYAAGEVVGFEKF